MESKKNKKEGKGTKKDGNKKKEEEKETMAVDVAEGYDDSKEAREARAKARKQMLLAKKKKNFH